MPLPVTALHAGLLALWIIYLTMRVVRRRVAAQISIGDGGDAALAHLVRAHGNAVETIPLALILLGLAEAAGAPALVLHALGLALLAGRLLHGAAFLGAARSLRLRVAGMMLTLGMIAATALGLIGHALATMIGGGA